ncbi:MAG: hypothetical protein QW520_01910 [Methanomassiliicoccales archaeon]
MSEFIKFLERIANVCGIKLTQEHFMGIDEYHVASKILHEINSFFYQKKQSIPGDYISEFHIYWKNNHKKILRPTVGPNGECLEVAKIFEGIYSKTRVKVHVDTLDLTAEEIANVRFFTSIQDFNIDIHARGNPFELYKRIPESFSPKKIVNNELLIDTFLNMIGADSQRDKRKKWMENAARLLVERYDGSALNICNVHNGDVLEIIKALTENERNGLSIKKAHMLLRDMADLGIWSYSKNSDKLDVMSDKNTMRVALRTGIVQFSIPLLASYLDVYCYQYSLVDQVCRDAWRKVWEDWGSLPNNHRPPTPASMDYLIYRLGKIVCKNQKRICFPSPPADFKQIESMFPQDRLAFDKDGYCIFNRLCKPERKILNPPNSISIKGMTGWDRGKTNEGGGGGISS